jgi:polysaccharide deacetylase family protein (PEP-CTERM system associated)
VKNDKKLFILTFDVEEWFHILDIDELESHERWEHFEVRIFENTYRILELLDRHGLKATFFILGWAAKKYPELIRAIAEQGHQLGTHSLHHRLIYKTSPEVFQQDLRESIAILEDITGEKVKAYRAPGFSMTRETFWAFDILVEEGIEIDSSIFPATRGHGGIKDFIYDSPFRIDVGGHFIKEFPLNIAKMAKLRIPFSGGGYFRILPFPVIGFFSRISDYLITYFHPRDFDPDQPVLEVLPLVRRWKSYTGLKGSFNRLDKYIKKFDFVDIASADRLIDWDKKPLMTL